MLEHGKVKLVDEQIIQIGDSPRHEKPYNFTIYSLDTKGQGMFKSKQFSRVHLSDVYNLYDDI